MNGGSLDSARWDTMGRGRRNRSKDSIPMYLAWFMNEFSPSRFSDSQPLLMLSTFNASFFGSGIIPMILIDQIFQGDPLITTVHKTIYKTKTTTTIFC